MKISAIQFPNPGNYNEESDVPLDPSTTASQWRAELRRMEDVMDARLRYMEERAR